MWENHSDNAQENNWKYQTAESANNTNLEVLLNQFRENTTRTLVIHPHDPTTTFLTKIYEGKGWNVVTDGSLTTEAVSRIIAVHDRVVLLGHGSMQGLFGWRNFIIDADLAPLLRKKEIVCIWCNADEFVREHGLKGFYSGMFISEKIEAVLYGITDTDTEAIQASNELFASTLGRYVDQANTLEKVKGEYVSDDDPVIIFNSRRLYSNMERASCTAV